MISPGKIQLAKQLIKENKLLDVFTLLRDDLLEALLRDLNEIKPKEVPCRHPHADLMIQYAIDAKFSATPWVWWEFKRENGLFKDEWQEAIGGPTWGIDSEYRRKVLAPIIEYSYSINGQQYYRVTL